MFNPAVAKLEDIDDWARIVSRSQQGMSSAGNQQSLAVQKYFGVAEKNE